jgi:hypothetical protein
MKWFVGLIFPVSLQPPLPAWGPLIEHNTSEPLPIYVFIYRNRFWAESDTGTEKKLNINVNPCCPKVHGTNLVKAVFRAPYGFRNSLSKQYYAI